MADHDETALVGPEELAQPHHRVGVEVVGRLVEEQRLGPGEEDPGQLDPAPLPTGEGAQRLRHQPVLDAERRGDLRGLGLGGVPTTGVEVGVGALVAAHRPLALGGVVAAHLLLGGPETAYDGVEPAGGQDPLADRHLGVAGAGVLGQVADGAGRVDLPGRGQALAGEDPGEGGLAGTVASDQAHLVAGTDPEGDVVHQQPRPGSDLELLGTDHQAG